LTTKAALWTQLRRASPAELTHATHAEAVLVALDGRSAAPCVAAEDALYHCPEGFGSPSATTGFCRRWWTCGMGKSGAIPEVSTPPSQSWPCCAGPTRATAETLDGRAIVERECAGCHRLGPPAASTFETLLDRTAPDLFYAGSKFRREWLVEWLQDPIPIRYSGVVYLNHLGFEGGKDQIAIDTVQSCSAKFDPERAEAVTEYLMTLDDPSMKSGVIQAGKKFSKRKALRLFRKQLPCIGCHTVRWGKRVMGGVSGPNLADAGNRLNPDWVYARIENPQHWDPKTWMPRALDPFYQLHEVAGQARSREAQRHSPRVRGTDVGIRDSGGGQRE